MKNKCFSVIYILFILSLISCSQSVKEVENILTGGNCKSWICTYSDSKTEIEFCSNTIFIPELNKMYSWDIKEVEQGKEIVVSSGNRVIARYQISKKIKDNFFSIVNIDSAKNGIIIPIACFPKETFN